MLLSKSFLTRIVSALAALALLVGIYSQWQVQGLKFIIGIVVIIGINELIKILFKNEKSFVLRSTFSVLGALTFAGSILSLSASSLVYAISLIFMTIVTLLNTHKNGDIQRTQNVIASSALGLFYVGLLPAFAFKILEQPQGIEWFVFLLTVVFSGDTMAYLFGVTMGKHKVMPAISPKKTWQGSIGGIIGSAIAGYLCAHYLLTSFSEVLLVTIAVFTGFVGQFGDFFESLLKRVADVKDSGKIMPGHGGVLDRIDAVLFGCPVVLLGIILMSHLF